MSMHWPGITPLNVWELPCDMWRLYVRAADQFMSQEETDRGV